VRYRSLFHTHTSFFVLVTLHRRQLSESG
jgi:hypothetical protein